MSPLSLRQLVACASPLEGSHTIRDHLSAINCGDLGGGETIILPVDSIRVEALSNAHTIELDDRNIEINISTKKYGVDISNDIFVAMENNDKEVNSVCS